MLVDIDAVGSTAYTPCVVHLTLTGWYHQESQPGIQQGSTRTFPRYTVHLSTWYSRPSLLASSFSVGTSQLQANICIGRSISCLSVLIHPLCYPLHSARPTPSRHTLHRWSRGKPTPPPGVHHSPATKWQTYNPQGTLYISRMVPLNSVPSLSHSNQVVNLQFSQGYIVHHLDATYTLCAGGLPCGQVLLLHTPVLTH